MAETDALELTERELALCAGEDPDAKANDDTATQTDEQVKADESSEVEAGKDAAVTAGAKEGATETQADWLNEQARQYGASYGLTEDEMKSFKGFDELQRAGAIFDKKAVKKVEPTTTDTVSKKEEAKPEDEIDPAEFEKEGYDESTVKLAKALKAAREDAKSAKEQVSKLAPELEEVRTTFAKQERDRHFRSFHEQVDKLDPDLFGKHFDKDGNPAALDKKYDDRRRELYGAVQSIKRNLIEQADAKGEEVQMPADSVILERARMMAFMDDVLKAKQAKMQADLSAQSKKRRPVGGSKVGKGSAVKGGEEADPVKSLANDPEVVKLWNTFQEANGAS